MYAIQKMSRVSGARSGLIRTLVQLAAGMCLTLLLSSTVFAQYGGGGGTGGGTTGGGTGPGYVPPKGGYGSGAAIGIGAGAAAGAGVLFLALHHHGAVTGCVQSSSDGMVLVDDKKNTSYTIVPGGIALKAGERMRLRGKKSGEDGVAKFQAKKVVKDLGACDSAAAAIPAHSAGQ